MFYAKYYGHSGGYRGVKIKNDGREKSIRNERKTCLKLAFIYLYTLGGK